MDITVEYLRNHIHELPSLVLQKAIAIYVYGSVARNDADNNSDCDLLICIDDCSIKEYAELQSAVKHLQSEQHFEFAFYQLKSLKEMQKKGSYFLWHIKTEAVLLFQKSPIIQELLDNLPPYKGTRDDFLEYSEILEDVSRSVSQDLSTVEYDLSVLAVLARNICIGCCYLSGDLDFGRVTPINKCIDRWKERFPFTVTEYKELYVFRFAFTRSGHGKPINVTEEYVQKWIRKIGSLLDLAFSLLR